MRTYSKYRHYWYPHIITLLYNYPNNLENTPKGNEAKEAIYKAIEETLKSKDGEMKVKAIKMLYFDKTYTAEGVAQNLYISRRTLDYWKSDFIELVGRNMNYL